MPSSNVVISPDTAVITSVKNPSRASCASAGRMLNENDMKNHRQLHRPCVVSQDGCTATVPEDDPRQQRPQIPICPCVEAGPILPQPL